MYSDGVKDRGGQGEGAIPPYLCASRVEEFFKNTNINNI